MFFLLIIAFLLADRGISRIINVGLNNYFGLNQHAGLLLIGHSHLMLAVDKETLAHGTGLKVSKYCREGVNVADRYQMAKQFLDSPYSDSLKMVLYGVDQFMFTGEGLSANSYTLFYPFMDDPNIDAYIKVSATAVDYWEHKLLCSTRYSDALLNSAIRGWRHDWSNYKNGVLDTVQLKEEISARHQRSIRFEKGLVRAFEETLQLITTRKLKVILINTPIAQMLNEYEPQKYEKAITYFQSLANDNEFVEYWDLNPLFSKNYDLFYDPIHLNPKGQAVVTEELIRRIKSYDISCHSSL